METLGNIETIADLTMNLYYEDFANNAEFFDLDDFINYTGIAYADLLGQEYITMYNQMRADGDSNAIEFSHDWLKTEVVKRQKDVEGWFAELSQPVMSFPFDKSDIGLQNIFPLGSNFQFELIRSSISQTWQDEFLPLTCKVFWALLGQKIYLNSSLKEPPPELKIVYVPAASLDLDIPASRQKMVIQNTIQLMREAAKGYIIKETNNGNLNPIIQGETDRNLIKP